MRIEFAAQSDQGRVRASNEDSFVASEQWRTFLVADGMGGHAAGEVASRMTAATVEEFLGDPTRSSPVQADVLRAAIAEANSRIYRAQMEHPEYAGMGCTVTALCLERDRYAIAQVGDSRAYLLREGRLIQLTRDHSLVWNLFENGILSKEELPGHPQKNLITRSIGPHPQLEIDLEAGEARASDIYLLCSDGLTDVLSDNEIRSVLMQPNQTPDDACKELIRRANAAGGPDNITVVVVRLGLDATGS